MHVAFLCLEAILMGAPYAFPSIPPLLGQVMFWSGVIGLFAYPVWINRNWILRHIWPYKRALATGEDMPLHEAASEAYGLMRDTLLSGIAEAGGAPLLWFATHFDTISKTPIYGNLKFSPKRERIDMNGYAFKMDGERIIAKEIWGNKIWENLCIKREDLTQALARLQETLGEAHDRSR